MDRALTAAFAAEVPEIAGVSAPLAGQLGWNHHDGRDVPTPRLPLDYGFLHCVPIRVAQFGGATWGFNNSL
jgi:hypothetical protein